MDTCKSVNQSAVFNTDRVTLDGGLSARYLGLEIATERVVSQFPIGAQQAYSAHSSRDKTAVGHL